MSDQLNNPFFKTIIWGVIGVCLMGFGLWFFVDPQGYQKKQAAWLKRDPYLKQLTSLYPWPISMIRMFGFLGFVIGLLLVYGGWFGTD